jgi:hypothetical protein
LSLIAPTPGHLLQRFEKIDELPIRIAYGLQMPPAQLYKLIPTPKRLPKKGEYKGVKKKAALKKRA